MLTERSSFLPDQILSRNDLGKYEERFAGGIFLDAEGDASPSKREATISVSLLTPGTILTADLFDSHHALLLRVGSEITDGFLTALLVRGIKEVVTDEDATKVLEGEGRKAKSDSSEASTEVEPVAEWVEQTIQQLDEAVESKCMFDVRMPPRGGAKKPKLSIKALREQVPVAQTCRDSAVKMFGTTIKEIQENGSIDITGLLEAVNEMQKCIEADSRLASLMMDYKVSNDEFLLLHGLDVAWIAMAAATWMGVESVHVREVGMAALLQDVGMFRVPESVVFSPQALSDDERSIVDQHPVYTLDVLGKSDSVSEMVLLLVYQSHERCDRTGYPRHRDKKYIHPMARLIAVADIYCAVTHPRPYRDAVIPYKGMLILLDEVKKGRIDPAFVQVFLDCFSLFPIGSYLKLSNGLIARVFRSNGPNHTKPVVVPLRRDGKETDEVVDLCARTDLKVVEAIAKDDALKQAAIGGDSRVAAPAA